MEALSISTWVGVVLAALVLVLPGAALYMGVARAAGSDADAGLPAALLPGIGLSVAFWPLLLLYVSLLGLRLTPVLVWAILALSLAAILGLSRDRGSGIGDWVRWKTPIPDPRSPIPALALGGMTLLALAFRLGDIQGLPVPTFGDSLHHTMITTIIETTGRVPTGYQPFVPVDTYTYHFGFHTLAAVLAMLTGYTPANAVLVIGQVLIVASLPVAYLLARTLFLSRLAGLAAALIVGFVSVMPAYYVNWGRYTQLAGLVLLPVAMALLVSAIRRDGRVYQVALAAFCVAGLVVVHYRILIFYGLFMVALAGWYLLANWRDRRLLLTALARASVAVVAGLAATAPWIWNLYTNYFWGLVGRLRTVSPEYIASYNSDKNLRAYAGIALPALGVLGVLAALAELLVLSPKSKVQSLGSRVGLRPVTLYGRGMPRPYGLWTLDLKGEAESGGLRPPVAALAVATWTALMVASLWIVPGAIGSYTVAITLYLPLSMLGGYATGLLVEVVTSRLRVPVLRLSPALLVVAPLAALVMGSWHVIDTSKWSYVHDADLAAFDWIKANTPAASKFLISSEITYAGRAVTAGDAGMWLPLLAGRSVSVPTLAAWTEHPIDPRFFTDTRTLAAYTQPPADPEVRKLVSTGVIPQPLPPSDPRMLAFMQRMGITHVYSGTAGGAAKPRLDVAAMRRDTCHYKSLYPADSGVYVFQVVYDCHSSFVDNR